MGFWRRIAMAGLVMFAVAALINRRAASDDCTYGHACREDQKDGRGCCPPPAADDRAAADKKAAADAKANEAKQPADATKAIVTAAAALPSSCPDDMVHVPGGTFLMGNPPGVGDDDEQPPHEVTLSGYCIDRTEVTAAAFARCALRGKCGAAGEPAKDGVDSLCNGKRADRRDHPVNCVDWNQASAYCRFVARRLPSEGEWEYAARGSDGRTYPWGNEAPSAKLLNACGGECQALGQRLGRDWTPMYDDSDAWAATSPVGSFPDGASPFGALDMAGNVWEWTADGYGPYPPDASTNPHGPSDGATRVLRGGGWFSSNASWVRGAGRHKSAPTSRSATLGFRCARGD